MRPFGWVVAGGLEFVGETDGALGRGQEAVELFVGQFACESLGVVVGPPVGQLAPGLDERPERVAHRMPIVARDGARHCDGAFSFLHRLRSGVGVADRLVDRMHRLTGLDAFQSGRGLGPYTRGRLLKRRDIDCDTEVAAESLADRLAAGIRGSAFAETGYSKVFG